MSQGQQPNFILIGAQKCGTTSLYMTLEQHPDIGMSRIKEPNYFGSSGKFWASTPTEYAELFSACVGKKAIGEASATYFYDEPALQRIQQELAPDTKIVVILRNPARRAFSHWGHLRYYQLFETLDFETALAQEEGRTILPRYRPGTFRYFWGGLYADKIRTCFELFGQERVHVMILEEVIQNQAEELGKLWRFLAVDASFSPSLKQENAASESIAPALTGMIVNRPSFVDSFFHLLPAPLRRAVFQVGKSVFYSLQHPRKTERPKLAPELYQALMRRYLPDIHALEALLGRDLRIWYRDIVETTTL